MLHTDVILAAFKTDQSNRKFKVTEYLPYFVSTILHGLGGMEKPQVTAKIKHLGDDLIGM